MVVANCSAICLRVKVVYNIQEMAKEDYSLHDIICLEVAPQVGYYYIYKTDDTTIPFTYYVGPKNKSVMVGANVTHFLYNTNKNAILMNRNYINKFI